MQRGVGVGPPNSFSYFYIRIFIVGIIARLRFVKNLNENSFYMGKVFEGFYGSWLAIEDLFV